MQNLVKDWLPGTASSSSSTVRVAGKAPCTRRVSHAGEARHQSGTRRRLVVTAAVVRLQELGADDVTLFARITQRRRPLQLHYRRHLHNDTAISYHIISEIYKQVTTTTTV